MSHSSTSFYTRLTGIGALLLAGALFLVSCRNSSVQEKPANKGNGVGGSLVIGVEQEPARAYFTLGRLFNPDRLRRTSLTKRAFGAW